MATNFSNRRSRKLAFQPLEERTLMAGDVAVNVNNGTMNIEIPADLQPFVRQQLELGCFQNEQQLLTEAVELLKSDREESLEGIRRGLADAAAGRVQPLTEALADLRREFNLPDPA